MKFLRLLRPRAIVLVVLWLLPVATYLVVGTLAVYRAGWLACLAWVLPVMGAAAWIVGRLWKPRRLSESATGVPLTAPEFWTPQDTAAIAVVEQFRSELPEMNRLTIADTNRYLEDAQSMAKRLAGHYHQGSSSGELHRLTLVEVLAVVHLAVEDMEAWVLENVPLSNVATVGQLQTLPGIARAVELGRIASFWTTTIANPAKLLTYPLWRQAGQIGLDLQDELIGVFYQAYLRRVGYYLIEMYSGRLKGGSRRYRQQFGTLASAMHHSGGDVQAFQQLENVSTTIAVIGQVKAGKSSLINALMQDHVAATSLLPETRAVARFEYKLPGVNNSITLLDTPGYSEADVDRQQAKEIRTAAEAADIVLLVMAANSAARRSDVQAISELTKHYRNKPHLKPPTIIAVLTHVDRLRPVREWSPPYDWTTPTCLKEESMAQAVAYCRELFGDAIAQTVCVYTGDQHPNQESVADNLVPALLGNLDHGHAAAILKAFYKQLSANRIDQLRGQFTSLLKSVGRTLFDSAVGDRPPKP
ncbi:tRNA modification GTPase TrmE [Rosistilla ulvae]|uniref:tRNA modification GTPase TrmE n=1 Tax=Rosistilla ulvae TaxID=1930277 RepID=A0A517LYH9_9BACT|nr:dynamin family protein [Rosistilla ulvae]QDS87670.1 tRNA modification GTPase TrmE [Rosistilla ulvae]